jgi:hypothetical protein
VVQRLDANFFRVRFDRLTPGERKFLRAMAGLGPGPQRSSDIADVLGVTVNGLGPIRSKLIKKPETDHEGTIVIDGKATRFGARKRGCW